MILMNYISAKYLTTQKRGIFRSAKFNNNFVAPKSIPKNVQKFLKMWKDKYAFKLSQLKARVWETKYVLERNDTSYEKRILRLIPLQVFTTTFMHIS